MDTNTKATKFYNLVKDIYENDRLFDYERRRRLYNVMIIEFGHKSDRSDPRPENILPNGTMK